MHIYSKHGSTRTKFKYHSVVVILFLVAGICIMLAYSCYSMTLRATQLQTELSKMQRDQELDMPASDKIADVIFEHVNGSDYMVVDHYNGVYYVIELTTYDEEE